MPDTQQVNAFNAAQWRAELKAALNGFIVKAAHDGAEFTQEVTRFKELFNMVPGSERAKPGTYEIMNRLASLAQASPSLFDPSRTPSAMKMQDVAISRCAVIMQLMHNGDQK